MYWAVRTSLPLHQALSFFVDYDIYLDVFDIVRLEQASAFSSIEAIFTLLSETNLTRCSDSISTGTR